MLVLCTVRWISAQDPRSSPRITIGGRVIPIVTRADPAVDGGARTEAYLTQPVIMIHGFPAGERISFSGMLNLEGLTLLRGELNAGIWGEGYVDRRHPHTYLHELTATGWAIGAPGSDRALSVSAGRGFAPFGTDDPMSRNLTKFPANHHLAQVLERYVVSSSVRVGPGIVEAGLFNGNEPSGVEDLSGWDRIGDSWSARITVLPRAGAEVQASFASVASPEFPAGSGIDHRKWSASARLERAGTGGGYALVEWARTDERFGAQRGNRFQSVLAEGSMLLRGLEIAGRLERTTRPEEERLADPFRTRRPPADVHLLGITRWNIASARLGLAGVRRSALKASPFLEISRASVGSTLRGQVFRPSRFYGASRIWTVSLGARLEAGAPHRRMGRYGASRGETPGHHQ